MSFRIQNHDFAFPAGVADQKTGALNFPLHPGLSKRDFFAVHIMTGLLARSDEAAGHEDLRNLAAKAVYGANYLLETCDLIDKEGNVR